MKNPGKCFGSAGDNLNYFPIGQLSKITTRLPNSNRSLSFSSKGGENGYAFKICINFNIKKIAAFCYKVDVKSFCDIFYYYTFYVLVAFCFM